MATYVFGVLVVGSTMLTMTAILYYRRRNRGQGPPSSSTTTETLATDQEFPFTPHWSYSDTIEGSGSDIRSWMNEVPNQATAAPTHSVNIDSVHPICTFSGINPKGGICLYHYPQEPLPFSGIFPLLYGKQSSHSLLLEQNRYLCSGEKENNAPLKGRVNTEMESQESYFNHLPDAQQSSSQTTSQSSSSDITISDSSDIQYQTVIKLNSRPAVSTAEDSKYHLCQTLYSSPINDWSTVNSRKSYCHFKNSCNHDHHLNEVNDYTHLKNYQSSD